MNHLHPDHIDRLLQDHKITLRELADLLGIDPTDHVPGHPSRLPLAALAKLADLLGQSPLGAQVAAGTHDGRQQLGSLLGQLPDGATRDHLASILRWTLDELEQSPRPPRPRAQSQRPATRNDTPRTDPHRRTHPHAATRRPPARRPS